MKILSPGREVKRNYYKVYIGKCHCGCKFEYTESEVVMLENNKDYIRCPECASRLLHESLLENRKVELLHD